MVIFFLSLAVTFLFGYITGQSFKRYREVWTKKFVLEQLELLIDAISNNNHDKTIQTINNMRKEISI
ncbi:MAG: hypothetical protein ACOC2E_00105 [Bacteroidota bacterium]